MKKQIYIIALLLFFPGFIHAGIVEKTYLTGNFKIEQAGEFHKIVFENSLLSGFTGQPVLPYFKISLLLPPGEVADQMEFSGHELTKIEGLYKLYPQQYSRPISSDEPTEFAFDKAVYSSTEKYPESQIGKITNGFMNGFSIAMSAFTPLVYHPASGEVYYYKSVTVRMKTKPASNANESLRNLCLSDDILKRVALLAQNYEMCDQYPRPENKSDDYDMLIITSQAFSSSFQQLLDLYRFRGIQSKVISLDSIYSTMAGQNNPEKIRNFIIQEYQNHGIQYVNLAGDAEIVPYRGFYCKVQSSSVYEDSNIPSDLYYSALDGNWNTDGDNLWAEIGEDDLLPEIAVARMTFSTQAELDILIQKTVSYQATPVLGEFRKPLMAGEYLYNNPLTYGCDYLDLLEGVRNDNGYSTIGYPEDYNTQWMCDEDASWTKSQLITRINEGTQFIHHVGHANTTYALRFSMSDITNANFSQVNGIIRNYALIYTHGCICGAFDANDCIAEKFLNINNFAVAGAFNSRYGWFNEGQTEGPSIHLHREFVNALFDNKENHIGAAHMISKIQTAPWVNAPGQWEEGALRWCFYDCNILGDPALRIWTDEPLDIEVDYDDQITVESTSLSVTVTSSELPAKGLICIMVKDGNIVSESQTNDDGIAIFNFDPLTVGTAQIFISGYNCQLHEYSVMIHPVYKVSGSVHYNNPELSPIQNVMVSLQDENFTDLASTFSGIDGAYQFEHLFPGTYHLSMTCNNSWMGCNATDALLVSLHTIQVPGFDLSGLPLMAADVNNSNSVSSFDALMILQRTVDLIQEFNIPDWLSETREFTIVDQDAVQNLPIICAGDVNGSDYQSFKAIEDIKMEYDMIPEYVENGLIIVPLYIQSYQMIGALTLNLSVNSDFLEIVNVDPVLEGLVSGISGNRILLAWSSVNPENIKVPSVLAWIHVREKVKSTNNSWLKIEAGSEIADQSGKVLADYVIHTSVLDSGTKFSDLNEIDIFPNPVKDHISFRLQSVRTEVFTLRIFNSLGNMVVEEWVENLSGNQNLIQLDVSCLPIGLYFFEIIFPENAGARKSRKSFIKL